MIQGINIGKCQGVNIMDCTQSYNITAFYRYIRRALTYPSPEHLRNIENINIYDTCPSNFLVIARGGYHPPSTEKGADLDIYLDQNIGHQLIRHKKISAVQRFLDTIFIHTFGHRFVVAALFHEIGHHVYYVTYSDDTKKDDKASEEYANKYETNLYGKMYPIATRYYRIFNGVYHLIYRHRILKDNEIRNERKLV